MKTTITLLAIFTAIFVLNAHNDSHELPPIPTLGTYPSTSIVAGTNTKITPNVAPTNAASIVAYTHTNFTGTLTVNPVTGIVTVTDAKQAGVYTVTVKAFDSGGLTTNRTFTLTVTNPNCSQGLFTGSTNLSVGTNPRSVAIGDFNGDGKQDLAIANRNSNNVSIRLGNGLGGFIGNTTVSVGNEPTSVDIGDFNGDGKQDLATANSLSDNASIRLGDGSGGFSGNTNVPVGIRPTSLAIGDFNNDGKQDIATANLNNNSVSIRLGNGNGGFSGNTTVLVGNGPISVATGDFNGDGKLDIATANSFTGNNVSIRLGDGNGNFTGNNNISVGNTPFFVAVGDFNGDGMQDIATANLGSNNVSIRLGDGIGGFNGSTSIPLGFAPNSISIGDFNGDGKQDFATSNSSSSLVSIRTGDGSGGFSGNTTVLVGNGPITVAIGDFNGDGKQDFATPNYWSSNVSIRLGAGPEINVQGNGISIADGDNTPVSSDHTDFGNVTSGSNLVRSYTVQNTGTVNLTLGAITITGVHASLFTLGPLSPASPIAPGSSATFTVTFAPSSAGLKTATVQIANNDCDEAVYDFAVQGTGVAPLTLGTYPNTTLVAGTNTKITPGVAPTNAVRIVAYTHTNFTGIITVNLVTGVLTVTDAKQAGIYAVTVKAFGNGGFTTTSTFTLTVTNPNCSQGFFSGTTNVATGNIPQSVAIGDFNGDGKQDFATANVGSNTVSIRLGDGLGGFAGTTNVAMGTGPQSVAIGDFNGDGQQDLATANLGSNTVSIRLGNGLGGFTGTTNVAAGVQPIAVAIGDFNGDGQQDFATANYSSASVSIRLGDGLGGFSGTTTVAVGNAPRSVAIGDFNGDGKQDFATANLSSNTVSIRLGNGLGGFSGTTNVAVGNGPRSVAIGDFNGDGKQDFATANPASNTVSIRLGNGLGGFSGTANLAVGVQPISVAIGDFNGDGSQDFATANPASNTVSIRLGNGLGGFSGTTNVATGNTPQSVAIGDFNSDGKQDFATANNSSNTVSIRLGGSNEINVQGNGVSIVDGDNTPVISDHTDFGNITSGSNLVRSYTVQNTGNVNLTLGVITITGVHASLFTLGPLSPASPIAPGSTATFTVTFAPSSAGLKTATVHIANDDCDEADYDFALQGIGICNLPLFSTCPAQQTVTAANGSCTALVTYAATVSGIPTPTLSYAFSGATTASSSGTGSGLPFNIGITNVVITASNICGSTTCSFTITVKAPEINVQGNATNILDGDNTPVSSDHTNIGLVNVGNNAVRTFTVQNTGTSNLSLGSITVTGTDAAMFSVGALSPASPIVPGGAATFTVTFAPTSPGLKNVTLQIANNDCNEANYDFALRGLGFQSPLTLGAYPNTTLIAGTNTKITPSVAPTNAVSIVAYTHTNFTGILTVNPGSGVITITDAKQAGIYAVTVKAFGFGGLTAIKTFTLTITNPNCSQGLFTGTTEVGVGSYPNSLEVGDFNGDGGQDIATANYISNTVSIRLGDGLGGFSGTTDVGVGSSPISVEIGDFNGDGKQDFAAANWGSNTVSIRLGDGLGGFSGTTNVAVGTSPTSVVIGDFNGDGKQDFAAANYNSNTVSIRLGDGFGGFSGTTNVGVGSNPSSVAVGDFNGDGKQDFAAANKNSNTVSIRLGDGLGGFYGTTNVGVGSNPSSVAVGDFNGDGKQDFAVANGSSNNVSIRLGDGLGSFSGTTNVGAGHTPLSVAIGDFNGDGKQDFATANVNSHNISIRLGDGFGGFSGTTNVGVVINTSPFSVVVGDFNGDGNQDFATANLNSNTVSIRLGGSLGGSNEINVQGNGVSIVDGDNTPVISDHSDFGNVTSGSNLVRSYTVQNTGTVNLTLGAITITGVDASLFTLGPLSPASPIAPGGTATFTVTFAPNSVGLKTATVHIANDDCDEADYDFAVQGTGVASSPILGTYPNISLVVGTNTKITPSVAPTNAVSIVAYSNTNFTGILTVNPATGIITITDAKQAGVYTVTVKAFGSGGLTATRTFTLTVTNPNCSQGLFTGTTNVGVGNVPYSIAVGDFNGDGSQDFATANLGSNTVSIQLGDGLGGFSGTTNVAVGNDPRSVAIGDFNGDGKQDFIVANYGSNTISIRLGDGLGGFSGTIDVAVESGPYSVAVGDFNGDGKQDFAAANFNSNTVSIRLGDGLGGFSGTTNVAVEIHPYSVALGDFNGDGKQDFAAANYNNSTVSIRLGDGLGGFSGTTNVAVGSGPYSVAVGDFNGDGKQDFATANNNPNTVSIRLGDGLGSFSGTTNVVVGSGPLSVAIGDFNGDGKQDFAAANFGSNTVSIGLGDGLGGFSGTTNVAVGNAPRSVAIGDFNGDGKQDIATANYNSNTVSIRLGGNNEINVQGNGASIADGDVSPTPSDHTDFGNVTSGSNLVRTYTVQNTGTVNLTLGAITITGVDASLFTLGPLSPASPIAPSGAATFTLTFSPSSAGLKTATVHIANDDCDEADYDFAVQGTGVISSPILGTYPNTSLVAGTNVKITPSAVPINALSIVAYTNTNFTGTLFVNPTTGVLTVTDANQVGAYSVTVKAFGTGGFQTTSVFTLTVIPSTCSQFASTGSSPVPVGDYPLAIAIGDFNNDGLQDIATANSNNFNHSVSIRMGDGTGSFTGNTTIPVGEDPYSVAIGDFNGDGKQDFATANYTSNSVSIRLGDGSGGFSGSTEIPVGGGAYGAYAVAIGDFNGDGKQDIAAANGTDGTVLVLIGDGSGGFSVTATLSVGSSPSFVAIGDFNADSYQDLAVVNIISNSVSILLGNGIGSFTASPHVPIGGLPVGSSPYSVAIGDFNGDNRQDLAVANIQDKSISIRLGDGLGGFSGSLNIPALAFPYIVAIADFNSDNKQDIAFSNSGGFDHTISIRFGDGSGSFSGNTNVPIDNNLITFAVGDLNNDGKLDLVAANYNVATVSSRLGEANEINVQGNSTTITAGDATPNLADHTDFGAIIAGSNLVRTFTIQNTANASLSIDAITMSGPNAALFTPSAITPASPIPAGNSATFSVTFKPLTAGTKLATVTIANDDCDEASYDFAIQGEGVGNCVNPTFTLCPSAQTVTTPTGFCAVAVSYIATATGTSTPTFSYLFSGATTGSGSGTGSGSSFNIGITNVVITATDNCGSNTCLFTITVKSPEIDVQGNSISIVKGDFSPDLADLTDFGSVIVGSKLVQTFTIQNTGNANLTIYDIEVIGLNAALFIVDPLSPASPILPGNSASFTITFKPTTTGLKTTTVYISNNTCNEGDYDFTIQGKGVPAFAPVEESSLTDQSHVDELAADNPHFDFSVYPNPSNNQITVDLLNPNLNLQRITILDVVGKILVEKEVIENQVDFDIHSLPSGVYFVKVETKEGKKRMRKFVKSN